MYFRCFGTPSGIALDFYAYIDTKFAHAFIRTEAGGQGDWTKESKFTYWFDYVYEFFFLSGECFIIIICLWSDYIRTVHEVLHQTYVADVRRCRCRKWFSVQI